MANKMIYMGTDVEWFFMKNGRPFSAHNILPDKEHPLVVQRNRSGTSPESNSVGVTFHWDGVQAEMTAAESFCRAYMIYRLRVGIAKMLGLAKKHNLNVNLNSSVKLSKKALEKLPKKVKEFGCDADQIAWLGGLTNPFDVNPETHTHRYAGTHIHLGADATPPWGYYDNGCPSLRDQTRTFLHNENNKILVVKILDIILGSPMVMLDQHPTSKIRRKLYGKAGVYRSTSYGLEYRVLGCLLLQHPALYNLALGLSRHAVDLCMNGHAERFLAAVNPRDIIRAINDNNAELALDNWKKIRELLVDTGETLYESGAFCTQERLKAFEFAVSVGKDRFFGTDLSDNWGLEDTYSGSHADRFAWAAYKKFIADAGLTGDWRAFKGL